MRHQAIRAAVMARRTTRMPTTIPTIAPVPRPEWVVVDDEFAFWLEFEDEEPDVGVDVGGLVWMSTLLIAVPLALVAAALFWFPPPPMD